MSTPNGTATAAPTSSSSGFPGDNSFNPNSSPPAVENSKVAHAPMPTNVICASEIWPDHPVSGTSDTMISAVTMAIVSRRTFGRSSAPETARTATNTIANPNNARFQLMRRGLFNANERRPSIRSCGRNSRARNRMIVGIAGVAVAHRPDQVRKFCWKEIERPMIRPPT